MLEFWILQWIHDLQYSLVDPNVHYTITRSFGTNAPPTLSMIPLEWIVFQFMLILIFELPFYK